MDEKLAEAERLAQSVIKQWRLRSLFPEEGPLRRELYPRHCAFFRAGAGHRERLFMAGNRVGKTVAGGFELTLHLTGRYPQWWVGRRFGEPVNALACGTTLETMRDIVQLELMGPESAIGTGLIPYVDIDQGTLRYRPNTNRALDSVQIKHSSGGLSLLGFKSYDQGRKAFEGTAKHVIWLDEEPPLSIYTECLTRTATTNGIMMITFTPLAGATDVVMDFIEKAEVVE